MKRSLALPGAIALCLHALLFLGPTSTRPKPAPESPPSPEQHEIVLRPVEDEPTVVTRGSGAAETMASRRPPLFLPEIASPGPVSAELVFDTASHDPFRPVMPVVPLVGSPEGRRVLAGQPGAGSIGMVVGADLLDHEPRATAQVSPQYPYELRRSGVGGEVVLAFVVTREGRVRDPYVVRSDHADLEEPALRAVARWRFEPGRKDGRIVSFRMALPFVFSVSADT